MPNSRSLLPTLCMGVLLTACAANGSPPQDLQSASSAVQAARQDPMVVERAPVALHEAEQALSAAEQAWERNAGEAEISHRAYLARQRAELAQTRARQAGAQARIDELGEERERVLMSAREQEAETARRRAELAKLEARQASEQVRELESELQAQAQETERGTVLVLSKALFAFDEAELQPGAERNLQPLVEYLQANPQRRLIIEGHTDSVGDHEYNRMLSQRRAFAVRDHLVQQGIDPRRLLARGYGAKYPVASNAEPAGRQQNRRVEVVIVDPGDPVAGRTRE